MPSIPRHTPIVLFAIAFVMAQFSGAFSLVAPALGQHAKNGSPAARRPGNGDKTFATRCAGCHGLDGRGGDRAPSIAVGRVQGLSDLEIFNIIQHGITGTGMPSFHSLTEADIKSVVVYLRILQGTKKTVDLPGDPERGKTLFLGTAGCSGCHMIAGQGGFIASDLSGYARTHSVAEIRSAITNPNSNRDRSARAATVTTSDGEKYVGRIRNEDNFSLQLQAMDGTFHFFAKPDLKGVEFSSQSLMPANYASTLSSDELNGVISYMMRVANVRESDGPKVPEEGWEEP